MRWCGVVLTFLVFIPRLFSNAQQWEQSYPPWQVHAVNDIVHWNGDTLYSCGVEGVFERSVDGGLNWERIQFPGVRDRLQSLTVYNDLIYIAALPPKEFVQTLAWSQADNLNLIHTFNPYTNQFTDESVQRTRRLTKNNAPLISGADSRLYFVEQTPGDSAFALYSTDGPGQSWTMRAVPGRAVQFHAVTDSILLFLSRGKTVNDTTYMYRSVDAGTTWSRVPEPFFQGVFDAVIDTDETHDNIYLGAGTRIFRSTDFGASWAETSPIPWQSVFESGVRDMTVAGGAVYALGLETDIYTSHDNGSSWVALKGSDNEKNASAVAHAAGGALVIGTGEGLYYSSTDDGVTWDAVRLGPIRNVLEWHFFSELDGVLIGQDEAGERYMYSTSDGGSSWEKQSGDYSYNSGKRICDYASMDEIYAYTLDKGEDASDFILWRTTDAGDSWDQVHTGTVGFGTAGTHHFHATESIYTFSTHEYTEAVQGIWYSYDRGAQWDFAEINDSLFHSIEVQSVQAEDGSYLFHGKRYPPKPFEMVIFRSLDSCKTWERFYQLDRAEATLIHEYHLVGPDTIIVLAAPSGGQGGARYYMTPDAGESWTIAHEEDVKPFHDLFIAPQRYSVYGSLYLNARMGFWTTDTLLQVARDVPGGIPVLFFLNADIGWIAAGQTIWHTTTGGIVWVEQPLTVTETAAIKDIYPNPVSAGQSAVINLHLPPQSPLPSAILRTGAEGGRKTSLRVSVYDLLGREVAVLYTGDAYPGTRTLTWQPSATLPAGVYMVRMTLGDRVWAKQVAVVK